jgi:phenylacetate-CoA ligase
MPVLGWECATTGVMHTSDDSTIVEVLVDGRPAEPGETGEVVATNLHAFASPFLRYRQGDLATRGATPCACGQSFATIREIQGREIDLLPLPDGRVLHPYSVVKALKQTGNGWYRQLQITQERTDRLVVRLVPAEEEQSRRLDAARSVIEPLLGEGVELEIRFVANIPLEPGGKFRVSRSLVRAAREPAASPAASDAVTRETVT